MKIKSLLALILATLISFSITSSFLFITYADTSDETVKKINQMLSLRKEKKFTECIALADSFLSQDETFMEAYYNKSMAYFQMSDSEKGLQVLEKQLKYNPYNELALYNAACACSLLKNEAQAIEYMKKFISLNIENKKSIAKDADFDNIRESEAYKKLMDITVRVGGEILEFDVPPVIINSRTMLPMRNIFEALGIEINWDNDTRTITATKDNKIISLTIDNKIAKVDGKENELETPPIIKDGRTLVPVRFISEAIGAKVDWNESIKLIDIMTTSPYGKSENYVDIKKQLDEMIAVSVVDGMWPEPYKLDQRVGSILIIAKDKKALQLFNSLDEKSRINYMYETTMANYALVVGCEPVHMNFVYDSRIYYFGDMYYDKKTEGIALTYYQRGLKANIIKQYKSTFNYKDFYLLPEIEKTTSKIGD